MLSAVSKYDRPKRSLRFKGLRSDREAFALSLIVGAEYGVCLTELLGRTRGRLAVAKARQIAIYLVHTYLQRPQDVVAELFRRDRTTVVHACQIVEDMRDEDVLLERTIARIDRRFRLTCPHAEVDHAA